MSVKVLLVATMLVVMSLILTACGGNKEAAKPVEVQKIAETMPKVSETPEETKSTVISRELKQSKNSSGKTELTKEEKLHDLEGMNRIAGYVIERSEKNAVKYSEIMNNNSPNRRAEQFKKLANSARSFSRGVVLLWWFNADEVKAFQQQHELLLSSLDARATAYDSMAQAIESNDSARISKVMATVQDAHAKSTQASEGMMSVLTNIDKKVKEGK